MTCERLQKFKPGLLEVGKDKDGNPKYQGYNGEWSNAYGPVAFAWCSAAYKPYRDHLIAEMKPAIDAGVDVVYLDESHSPMGNFLVDNMTVIQGQMHLQKEIQQAYPNVAIMTEQFNPMNSYRSSFALTSHDLGHPLSGYLFHKFIKFTGWWGQYMPVEGQMLDFRLRWGYLLPATDGNPSPWTEVVQAFQKYNLDSAPMMKLGNNQLSAFAGDNGIKAFFEKNENQCGLVVYPKDAEPIRYGTIELKPKQ